MGIIVVDNSENRSSSSMPELSSLGELVKFSPNLEEITGADIMISPKLFPFTNLALIQQHLKAGAILIQVKRGLDFISSLGERLNLSLAKMQSISAVQSQSCLLAVGIFEESEAGFIIRVVINGKEKIVRPDKFITGATYEGFVTARDSWSERGGIVYTDLRDSSPKAFINWLKKKHDRICKYADFPSVTIYPDNKTKFDSPLQKIKVADDSRQLLASIHGIGPKRVESLLEYFGTAGFALSGLSKLSTIKLAKKTGHLVGIGESHVLGTKRQLGLKENQTLEIVEGEE